MPLRTIARKSLPFAATSLATVMACAADFRMESEIFVGRDKEPAVENLTIFVGGRVYDFLLTRPLEITVFDPKRQHFDLLDVERSIKASISMEQVHSLIAASKAKAEEKSPTFFLDPQFKTEFDQKTSWLTLSATEMTYSVKCLAPKGHESAAAQYREFADGYTRLNAIRQGNLPPFARLALNQTLAEKGFIPEAVERKVVVGRGLARKKLHSHSRHIINWTLSNSDRERVEDAGGYISSFRPVSLTEYLRLPSVAKR